MRMCSIAVPVQLRPPPAVLLPGRGGRHLETLPGRGGEGRGRDKARADFLQRPLATGGGHHVSGSEAAPMAAAGRGGEGGREVRCRAAGGGQR